MAKVDGIGKNIAEIVLTSLDVSIEKKIEKKVASVELKYAQKISALELEINQLKAKLQQAKRNEESDQKVHKEDEVHEEDEVQSNDPSWLVKTKETSQAGLSINYGVRNPKKPNKGKDKQEVKKDKETIMLDALVEKKKFAEKQKPVGLKKVKKNLMRN